MANTLKNSLTQAIKSAMKAKDKERLVALRLIKSECQRVEVDTRAELDDQGMLAVMDKMLKQRRESIAQYQQANREDLVHKESQELAVIQSLLPEPLSDEAITTHINEAMTKVTAHSMQDMGRVMQHLTPVMQGRADMKSVSARVKALLSNKK